MEIATWIHFWANPYVIRIRPCSKKKRPWIPIFRELPPEIFSPPGRWKIAPCGTSAVSRTCQGWSNKLGEGEMIRPPSATVVRLGFQWIATLVVLVVVYRTCHDLGAVHVTRWTDETSRWSSIPKRWFFLHTVMLRVSIHKNHSIICFHTCFSLVPNPSCLMSHLCGSSNYTEVS